MFYTFMAFNIYAQLQVDFLDGLQTYVSICIGAVVNAQLK